MDWNFGGSAPALPPGPIPPFCSSEFGLILSPWVLSSGAVETVLRGLLSVTLP